MFNINVGRTGDSIDFEAIFVNIVLFLVKFKLIVRKVILLSGEHFLNEMLINSK